MSTQPLNMQFRVFLNRAERKMWAVGVNHDDRIWTTLWGVIREESEYTYRFTHERDLKPLNHQGEVDDIIDSKLAKGYEEVGETYNAFRRYWCFVRDPNHAKTLRLSFSLDVAQERSLGSEAIEEVTTIAAPDDTALDAAGYAPIGF